MVINEQKMDPMPVIIGKAAYPDAIIERINEGCKNIISIDALEIARKCGNIKAVNVVLLGVLAKSTEIEKDIWLDAINEVVPAKFLDVNIKAFEEGYQAV